MAQNNGEFICADGGIDSSDDDLFAAISEVEDDAPSDCMSQITPVEIKQKV